VKFTCCCSGIEDAESKDCWHEFDLPDDEMPETFCGDPICPPCMEELREVLAELKGW